MKLIYGIAIAVVFTMAESRDWPCPAEGGSSINHVDHTWAWDFFHGGGSAKFSERGSIFCEGGGGDPRPELEDYTGH